MRFTVRHPTGTKRYLVRVMREARVRYGVARIAPAINPISLPSGASLPSSRWQVDMSTPPDVSVVIPTCNRPELATRAVGSALAQTHRNLEVIVVVDGPDEPTHRALKEIDDDRLRVIGLPERGKAPNARNVGAR